jgi:hypothetical protein
MASAATGPRGSVVLKTSALKKVGSTQCGKVNSSWISGTVTKIKSKNYFVSYTKSSQLYSADAKKYRGTQKKRLLNLSSDFKKKGTAGNKKCSRYNVSAPVATTMPVETTAPIPTTTTTTVDPGLQPLKFDVSTAVALALADTSVATAGLRKRSVGSNLQIIDVDGKTKDAVVGGIATVSRFLIAPNDLLYVQFYPAATVGDSPCVLAQISKTTGDPICIERDAGFIFVPPGQSVMRFGDLPNRPLVNDVQFDASGAIYYMGIPSNWKQKFPSAKQNVVASNNHYCSEYCDGAAVVRRVKNGVVNDFGDAFIELGTEKDDWFWGKPSGDEAQLRRQIDNFLVLEDGNILIYSQLDELWLSGDKCSNSLRCTQEPYVLDLWSPSRTKTSILPSKFGWLGPSLGDEVGFLKQVNSQEVLIGISSLTMRLDLETLALKEVPLFSNQNSLHSIGVAPMPLPLFSKNSFGCNGELKSSWADYSFFFCNYSSSWRHSWTTPNGDVYALSGNDKFSKIKGYADRDAIYQGWIKVGALYGSGVLYKTWPTVETTRVGKPEIEDDLVRVEVYATALDKIFAYGPAANGQKRLVQYDTSNRTVVELIPPSVGIQIDSLSFSSKHNSIFFTGVRSSSNESVVGKVQLGDLKLSVVTSSTKISDLQGFKS